MAFGSRARDYALPLVSVGWYVGLPAKVTVATGAGVASTVHAQKPHSVLNFVQKSVGVEVGTGDGSDVVGTGDGTGDGAADGAPEGALVG